MNLTVKPKHLVEESLIGYLLRLASRNGFLYVQDMVEARFVDAAVKNNFLKVQNSLPLIAFREGNLFQSTSNALWKNVRYIHPKVCIACLEQLGLIREEHLQGNTHYCAHHSKPLVTSCMSCGHTLKWDVDLIDARCTNPSCGCKLKPVDVPYKLSSDQVLDCLVANQFIKGQITTYVKQKAFIDTQNFPQAVADGLAFLNNEKVIFDWCHNQWQHSPHILPANLRFHSFTLLKSMLLSKWVGIESLSRDKYNSPADFQVGHLKHYLNVDWATRLLHMNQDELSIIKDLGLIETLTKNRLSAGSVINVMPLFEMLVNQSKEKLLSLKPLSHMQTLMSNHLTLTSDVIRFIYDTSLDHQFVPGKTILDSILVDEADLKTLCQRLLNTKQEELITLEQASRITKMKKSKLIEARKRGLLPMPGWYQTGADNLCYCRDAMLLCKKYNSQQLELVLFDEA